MNKIAILISALALLTLVGCAAPVDQVARDAANDAAAAAVNAQVCCDASNERLDRMYQKILGK